jgi:transcriptional antiterminator Rof (Rho-off)
LDRTSQKGDDWAVSDYLPIACGLHSRYELAVMHRMPLTLCWRGSDGLTHLETLLPEDLETRNGEEFLVLRNGAGEQFKVRLDRITAVHSDEFDATA